MKPLTPIALAGFAALAIGTGTAHADGIQLQPTTTDQAAAQPANDVDIALLPNCSVGSGINPSFTFRPFVQGGIGFGLGSVQFTTTVPTCYIMPPFPLPGLGYISSN